MDRDFRAFLETPDPGVKPSPQRRRGGYNAFGWTVCLLLLTGVAMASWISSFYVFSHPENPDCYNLLKKLNKIDPPRRFDVTAAPPGKFFTAKELYDSYLTMSQEDLDAKNEELLRNYLRNYTNTKTPVPYIWGRFTTTGVYELGKADMFPSGMVAVADSADCPYVRIEHIYPTAFANLPRARQMLATDPVINLEKTFDLSTIVHVAKLEDGRMLFTVVPIAYGQYAYKEGISSTFRLDPPASLNLEAGMPVVKTDAMEDAMKTFALYRKNKSMLAKGKMITLPPAATPAPLKTTDLYTATSDIPAEAYQPLKPEIEDTTTPPPPAALPAAPENTITASRPPVTAPAEELPPAIVQPRAGMPQVAQTAAEPPPAAAISQPAPVVPIASVPAVVKTSRPSATVPAIASTTVATVASVVSRTAPPAKPEKTVAKTSAAALSSLADAAWPVTRVQQSPAPAAAIATTHPAAAKPKVSTLAAASAPLAPVKPAVAPVAVAPSAVARTVPLPAPAPVEYAEAAPSESTSAVVKLTPFFTTRPQPPQPVQQPQEEQTAVPARTASWQTYRPGMMPRGRLVNTQDASQLADLGVGRERVYVDGRFIVTASSDGRAVLRPMNGNGGIAANSVRIVVEYPAGATVPAEGTQVARGTFRPFQVIDVRRDDSGQVDVYAREVTQPVQQQSSPDALRNYRPRVALGSNVYD